MYFMQQWFTLFDPEMHSLKKGNLWSFGMKTHIEVDAEPKLVLTARYTSGNVSDIAEANILLRSEESLAFGGAGYQVVVRRADAKEDVTWHIAMRANKRRAMGKENEVDALIDQAEKFKAPVRAKEEHPFWVIKRQFGFARVRYRGLKKKPRSFSRCLRCPTRGWRAAN